MFVTDVNDVKIYNLSAGKSLPDWLSEQKRRALLKKNVDLRRRIELLQDFDMPGVSTSIRLSTDGQYILATGTYKPRVKCFDVNQLSMKFERCFDSEVYTFEILSEDYSKLVFLHCDRFVELHAAHGRHYRLRIPKFGRDMSYHRPSCDLFIIGQSSDVYRLNLERGQFMQPFETGASGLNVAKVNPEHHLLCVGSEESTVEAWDPRDRQRCGLLDVALTLDRYKEFPSITAMKFKNALQMAVGTASGHVCLFDLRASKPILVKDHLNQLPVKRIAFNSEQSLVYSMDSAMLKIWDETSGKQRAYIESASNFNDFCTVPGSGMFFFAQEDVKMQTYYVPAFGPAPRWCSFLDNLTEEIESEAVQNIYDDYKFVTRAELEKLGLAHLEGTTLLKAYMHGFFIDVRLYNKASDAAEPFAFERYRREKIRAQIEATRPKRLQIQDKLPHVNKDLAQKLTVEEKPTLLKDDRFKAMFENPDFQIDQTAEEYRLLAPVLSRLSKTAASKDNARKKKSELESQFDEVSDKSSDEDLFYDQDESEDSSEDEKSWTKEVKEEYKKIRKERKAQEDEDDDGITAPPLREPKMYEIKQGAEFRLKGFKRKASRAPLGERVVKEQGPKVEFIGGVGNRQMTFSTVKPSKVGRRRQEEMKRHREERRKVIRPTTSLRLKKIFPK